MTEDLGLHPESHGEPQKGFKQGRDTIRCVFIKRAAGGWAEKKMAGCQRESRKAGS